MKTNDKARPPAPVAVSVDVRGKYVTFKFRPGESSGLKRYRVV